MKNKIIKYIDKRWKQLYSVHIEYNYCFCIRFPGNYYCNKYDEISIEQLFDYFGGLFLSSNVQRSTEDWNIANTSLVKMKEYISDIKEVPKELAKSIVGLYNFTEETRMRVRYSLQEFYLKGYKPY